MIHVKNVALNMIAMIAPVMIMGAPTPKTARICVGSPAKWSSPSVGNTRCQGVIHSVSSPRPMIV